MALGYEALILYKTPKFLRIKQYVRENTSSLKNEDNKNKFREGCLALAEYLIREKKTPPSQNPSTWEGTLKEWIKPHYKPLDKFGGCFVILDEEDKRILDLKYKLEDFCKEKKQKIKEIKCLKGGRTTSNNCNGTCLNQIREYNAWINEKKLFFDENNSFIKNKCKNGISQFQRKNCNILETKTFNKLPICNVEPPAASTQSESEVKKENPQDNDQKPDEYSFNPQDLTEAETKISFGENAETIQKVELEPGTASEKENQLIALSHSEVSDEDDTLKKTHLKLPSAVPTLKATENSLVEDQILSGPITIFTESNQTEGLQVPSTISSPDVLSASSSPTIFQSSVNPGITNFTYFYIIELTALNSIYNSKISYRSKLFKKKVKVKRRHVKFLRILLPSFSDRKSKSLSRDLLEHSPFDKEEIIKKIKIHENSIEKNVNALYQKKDRILTIIEVHMQVFEEFKNEEWEYQKLEFLEICLDEFIKGEYITKPNLTNDEKIIKNIKSSSNIKRKQILWNKLVERHRNLTKKFKEEEWFNNLKNEWKREQACLKKLEEPRNSISNEIQKVSFLEKEKDIWRQWISINSKVIEQQLEQYCFNGLTEEIINISETYQNEILLIDKEFENKKIYEELYICIKKKVLAKLCILVLMMVLEDCKKEEHIENKQLHLDSSISECMTEKNADEKLDITEKIRQTKNIPLESNKNKEINDCIGEDYFKKEIEDWIREDCIYVNFIDNDTIINKSNKIAEKYAS
ncbi:STP1 protein [Plasmodium malariae]|uniref:STP1 protein n=1 Tax=Plasmodium malariae TaxID=5858 RepID=A0A1A8WXL4_PLAMA|nr:STP1 protein [Plasmodium malariae]